MQSEPVMFGATFEALFSGVKDRLGEQGRNELRLAGVDPDRIQSAYPVETFRRVQAALHTAVYPSLNEDEAMYRLGSDYILGLKSTVLGRAVYAMATLIGPRRMLERMTRNVRTSNNFLTTEVEALPDGSLRMLSKVPPEFEPTLSRIPLSPHYFRGILKEALVQTGAKNATVSLESHDPIRSSSSYRIELGS